VVTAGLRASAASALHELYRELRRHAGDQRLPAALRRRLREAGHRSYEQSSALRAAVPYARRRYRDASPMEWAPGTLDRARAEVAAAGVPDAPLVAFELRTRFAVARAVTRSLVAGGYTVVRLGDSIGGPLGEPGVIELQAGRSWSRHASLHVLTRARLAIVASRELQQQTYLTNTPSLAIDATDPFRLYPIRANGLLLLATALDLDSGRELPVDEWLTEDYVRDRRTWGYRGVSAGDLLAAIHEIEEGVAHGWRETDPQVRFRDRAVELGRALAPAVPFVAEWGPDDGFLGDGRLARVQAARLS
jgi:hypothetical protein